VMKMSTDWSKVRVGYKGKSRVLRWKVLSWEKDITEGTFVKIFTGGETISLRLVSTISPLASPVRVYHNGSIWAVAWGDKFLTEHDVSLDDRLLTSLFKDESIQTVGSFKSKSSILEAFHTTDEVKMMFLAPESVQTTDGLNWTFYSDWTDTYQDWSDHMDTGHSDSGPHTDWSDSSHSDTPHTDSHSDWSDVHSDWSDYTDSGPHTDWSDTSHSNVPHTDSHNDWSDGIHTDWFDYSDVPPYHSDYQDWTDGIHSDWTDSVAHSDWSDATYSDSGPPHLDWTDHNDAGGGGAPHQDWTDSVPHEDWSNVVYSDDGVPHLDWTDSYQDWTDHQDGANPHQDWSDIHTA